MALHLIWYTLRYDIFKLKKNGLTTLRGCSTIRQSFLRDVLPRTPPPTIHYAFNVVLTTVRNTSLNPSLPSRRYIIIKRPQTLAFLINNMISAGYRQQSKLYKIGSSAQF